MSLNSKKIKNKQPQIKVTMAVRCQQDLLFSSQTCRVFDSVLLIYWVSPSNFRVRPSVFWLSPQFFELDLFCFDSVLPTFFTASFPFLPLCVDLMTVCAVDKVNDGGVCRKRLLHYMERKIEIALPENLIKKILRNKKKERKKWNYF